MSIQDWQLQTPVSAIVFDCDGTLSAIEGVNELAKYNGVHDKVALLTETAMGTTGINPDLYKQRLDLVYPHREQVLALGQQYFKEQVPDADTVITLLKRLNKSIYVVSAGLKLAVNIFGELLKIPEDNIFAVHVEFDTEGNFLNYDHTSPLIHNHGKRDIVKQLKIRHPQLIHIGDGLNDYVTHDLVTRFIGYGGIYYREKLALSCNYYIHTPSLTPLLPLALTPMEVKELSEIEQALYLKGLAEITGGNVKFSKQVAAAYRNQI